MKVLFRPVRETVDQSMLEVREFGSLKDMLDSLASDEGCDPKRFLVHFEYFDDRIDWKSYAVLFLTINAGTCIIGHCTFKEDIKK